jgi:hypothetical protein
MSASTNQLRVEQRRALDKPTRALASLSRFDYADRFILTTTTHATPRRALAMFGSVPDRIERLIWVGVLRFPLRQDPGADVIAGRSVTGLGPLGCGWTTPHRSCTPTCWYVSTGGRCLLRQCAGTKASWGAWSGRRLH